MVKYSATDRNRAIDMLMRHAGMFDRERREGTDHLGEAFATVLGQLIGRRNGIAGMVTEVPLGATSGR
jgi:hypothetical protein